MILTFVNTVKLGNVGNCECDKNGCLGDQILWNRTGSKPRHY